MDDQREVHGGRMDAAVQKSLGNVQGAHAGFPVQAAQVHDEFVHARSFAGHVVGVPEQVHEVVGVEDRVLGCLGDALPAQGQQVRQGPYHHQEVPLESADAADGRRRRGQLPAVSVGLRHGARQELRQMGLAAHGPGAGTAAAVGGGEGLVEVQVDHVKAHVAGTDHAHDRVEVGAVVVALTAGLVDDPGDLQNVLVEDAQGVGVGEHQTRRVAARRSPQGFHVHAAVGAGGDVDHREARHHRRGRVGAVGRVGHENLGPARVPAAVMVGLDEQQTGEFAVGAGRPAEPPCPR